MTDKQIIVDGVDVSGCEFFDECEVQLDWSDCLAHCSPYPEGACYGDCSEYPNCYYKQLKRKEQECERLKKRISNYKCPMDKNADYCGHLEDYGELLGQLDQLKAENEQLKNFHINLVGVKECEIRELAELKADNKHLNDLLNQALKELEEVALNKSYKYTMR